MDGYSEAPLSDEEIANEIEDNVRIFDLPASVACERVAEEFHLELSRVDSVYRDRVW